MRSPIQVQLLIPMLSVVILAIILASLASAYVGAGRAQRQREEDLRRVVDALTEAQFPITESVLRQISGFSGAQFVLFGEDRRIQAATLPVDPPDVERLWSLRAKGASPTAGQSSGVRIAGREYLLQRVALVRGRPPAEPGTLLVLYPADRGWLQLRQAAYPALLAGGVAAAAVVVLATLLAQRFVRPIRQLGGQAASIAAGRFEPLPLPARDDELRDLAVSINRMQDQLRRYEDEVRRSERLRTLGQLGAGMAHHLRNAATGALMAIELHQRQCSTADQCQSLPVALQQLRLMEAYLQRFLALGRGSAAAPERIRLAEVIDAVLPLVRPACEHAHIALAHRGHDQPVEVEGDAQTLQELLVNLLMNAIEAAGRCERGPGEVAVELTRSAGQAVIRVLDNGPGPAPEIQDRLFEPFATNKPEGVGLGLFVARQIAEAHGGTIRWERLGEDIANHPSPADGGDATGRAMGRGNAGLADGPQTCFTVELPLFCAEASHVAPLDRG